MIAQPPQERRAQDDLVDDRAIDNASADHFGLADFAAQAASTLGGIRTPANIAIYAPWGSGKTSLANLLRKEIKADTSGFVYFDAFKYAEAPLRREFIRRVAKDLAIKDAKFDRGLYEEENRSGFNLEGRSLRDLGLITLVVGGGALALAGLIALGLALLSKGSLGPEWVSSAKVLIPAIFSPVVIIAPLIALVGAKLNVNRRRYAPQSDEEFERLFCEVVEGARKKNPKWGRLVIFIDELDRCGADEVASTLETLRTFLEVEGCIFVVAADRSVLETAVAKQSRQETPYNLQNPYYSAGSAYLDKIFQYQWQLPPMMPSSLSRFAESLVKGREVGLWHEIDASEVVSVLVPLHVQSPRRVKELLNAYAMAYRIAERRVADHHLDGDLRERAAELAKLVCLQLEFPTFANDLPNEPRLPQFIVQLAETPETVQPKDVPDEIWRRAKAYAKSNIKLDIILADQGEGVGLDVSTDESSETAEQRLVSAQGDLLLRYLQKTRRVPGPEADLVFMEGPGFAFGLPSALATRLNLDATDGAYDRIASAIAPLPPDQQKAALQLLGLHVKEALPGVEGANALSSMLRAVGSVPELDVSDIVDDLADAATAGIGDGQLPPDDLIGAIRLGLATTRPVGRELVTRALEDKTSTADVSTARFIAFEANKFSDDHIPRVAEVIASLLVELPWDDGVQAVLGWTDERAVELLTSTRQPMLDRIIVAKATAAEAVEAAANAAGAQPPADAPPASVTEETAPTEEDEPADQYAVDQLSELITAARDAERKVVLEALLELTLAIDTKEARGEVASVLPQLGAIRSSTLTEMVLVACRRRTIAEQPKWLESIDETVFADLSNGRDLLEGVVHTMWTVKEAEDEANFPVVKEAVTSASRLAKAIDWLPAATLGEAVVAGAALSPVDATGLTAWLGRIRRARVLEDTGLLLPDTWRPSYLEATTQLAATAAPDDASHIEFRAALLSEGVGLAKGVTGDSPLRLYEALGGSLSLTASDRCLARARLAGAATSAHNRAALSLSVQELTAAYDQETGEEERSVLAEAVGTWLSGTTPSVEDAWAVLDRYGDEQLPDTLQHGLSDYAGGLSSEQRTVLSKMMLDSFPGRIVSDELLEAVRFHNGDLRAEADLIVELFSRATNEEHRRGIMRIWSALRLTNHDLIRKLLNDVMMPLVRNGKTSRAIVLENLNLVQALPNKGKRALAEQFEQATDDDGDEWGSVSRRLVEAGFMKEGGMFLSKHPEHLG